MLTGILIEQYTWFLQPARQLRLRPPEPGHKPQGARMVRMPMHIIEETCCMDNPAGPKAKLVQLVGLNIQSCSFDGTGINRQSC